MVAEECFKFLQNNMSIGNCYGVVYLAEKYSSKNMKQIAQQFAVNNFRVLSNSDDFTDMKYEHLVSLLSNNHLNVTNECEVSLIRRRVNKKVNFHSRGIRINR